MLLLLPMMILHARPRSPWNSRLDVVAAALSREFQGTQKTPAALGEVETCSQLHRRAHAPLLHLLLLPLATLATLRERERERDHHYKLRFF